MSTLALACERYLEHLRIERCLSPRTVESYANDLRGLQHFLSTHDVTRCAQVETWHVQTFLQSLSVRGLKATTQARVLATLRGFFAYARREGLIAADPARRLRGPKRAKRLPATISQNDTARLLTTSARHAQPQNPVALRNHAAVEVLYGAGLRASELCDLLLANVDFSARTLRVLGKGGRERVVPMGRQAADALQRYVHEGRASLLAGRTSTRVFVGERGLRFTRLALYKTVVHLCRQAGIAGGQATLSPHVLRHAFATHLVQRGADVRIVQQLLGHQSVTTTEIYTHLAREDLSETIEACHPLGDRLHR